MAAMAAVRITTLAVDDVRKAFDNVPIAPLMETFAEHINDPSLLQLVETILRGGEDRGRAVGIPQGNPLSPLALNVMLHHAHDLPLEADANFPPLFRYADNLAATCARACPKAIRPWTVSDDSWRTPDSPSRATTATRSTCARAGRPACWASGSRCTKADCAWTWEKTPWSRTWPCA